MLKRIATILLWLLAPVLIFISYNLYHPDLMPIRGRGDVALLVAELVGIAALLWSGYWRRGGIAAKLLVLAWCLSPLAMGSAIATFHLRKHAVLRADGNAARELGRHFIAGYTSFDEVAPLAAKGLIGGIYVTWHNIEGRTADDLKSEIARLQSLRSAAELAPLIVAVDQEGGIVSHLSPPLTSLPRAGDAGGTACGPSGRAKAEAVRPHSTARELAGARGSR